MVPLDVMPMMKPQLFCYTCAGGTGAIENVHREVKK